MTSTSHLHENLDLLEVETVRLVRTVAGLDDTTPDATAAPEASNSVRAPSRCRGWTRAHVITHVCRNADGMGNLVHWAVTGERTPQYLSPESRDADIERGSSRPAAEQLTDLEDSAARFDTAARGLAGAPEEAQVEARDGHLVAGRDLVTARLREVVFHHVDLNTGYTFADADPGFVKRSLDNAVARLKAAADAPSLKLRSDEGDVWSVGDGAAYVTGGRAALLLWLARGDGGEVACDRPLPTLPAWG